MADHSKPTVTSAYANFVAELDARLGDLAKGCDPARTTVTNPATDTIRWNSAGKKWEKWSGSAWGDLSTGYAIPILGGSVDGCPIGAATPNTGKFTSLTVTGNATINGYADVVRNSDGWLLRHARTDGTQVCGVKSYGHSASVGLGFVTNDTQRVWLSREGAVGIGAAPGAADVLRIGGTFSTASSVVAANANAEIPASVTGRATYFATMAATAAASFSMSSLVHFAAAQGVFGSGSNVAYQYGFLCESTLIGAEKNYGFYGNIPSGTDRWNFYAGGSAPNLFAGTTYIGGTTSGLELAGGGGGGGLIRHRVASAGQLDISSEPQDGTSAASVRMFRYTNTTGNVAFSVLVGDNSPASNHVLAGNNNQLSTLCNNNGRVRIGSEADTGAKLQIGGSLTMSGPMRLGQYTLSTLPSAAAYSGHLIDVTNASGGAKVCRSNGSVWQVLNTTTTVS